MDTLWRFVELDETNEQVPCNRDVHILDVESKERIIDTHMSNEEQYFGSLVLESTRSSSSSSTLANLLVLKPFNFNEIVFRLINKRTPDITAENSYIALSYRWTKPQAKSERDPDHHILIPISMAMFQAVMEEKQSAEGLWFDQMCIDQTNEIEKASSIGSMDTIYKNARLVVVALDDVTIDESEEAFLKHFELAGLDMDEFSMKSFEYACKENWEIYAQYAKGGSKISQILGKIINSEYFKRAWCHHELRLGQNIVFLAHCYGRKCIRMTATSLYILMYLVDQGDEELSSKLWNRRQDLYFLLETKATFNIKKKQQYSRFAAGLQELNFLSACAGIWDLEAGGNPLLSPQLRYLDANLDRVSIVLNTSEFGVSLGERSVVALEEASKNACDGLMFAVLNAASQVRSTLQKEAESSRNKGHGEN